jgi:hypothetical protein
MSWEFESFCIDLLLWCVAEGLQLWVCYVSATFHMIYPMSEFKCSLVRLYLQHRSKLLLCRCVVEWVPSQGRHAATSLLHQDCRIREGKMRLLHGTAWIVG